MTWHPTIKFKPYTIDIHDRSFPWRNGKPDWPTYYAMKLEAQRERNKGKKQRKLPKFSRNNCQYVGIKGVCGVEALGMMEVQHNGQTALAPVCEMHREELSDTENQM